MNAHIISHKTPLKHFKTLRYVSILSDHHQGALFLAKVILKFSQFAKEVLWQHIILCENVLWSSGFSLQQGYHSNLSTPKLQNTSNQEQYDQCGNSTAKSQAPDDGYINVRIMLST